MCALLSCDQCSLPVSASRQYRKPEKSLMKSRPSGVIETVEMLRLILSKDQIRPVPVMSPVFVASMQCSSPTPSPCSGSCPTAT